MSDFLDRLAARAIGSETSLMPRLPSLFEPLQRAPIMPLADAGEALPDRREAVPAVHAVPGVAPTSATPASTSARPAAAPVAPIKHVVGAVSASAAVSTAQHALTPSTVGARASAPAVDRPAAPPVSARPAMPAAPLPVQPRQARVAPDRPETVRTPASNGVLLPAPAPVFAVTLAAPARSGRTVAARAAAARTEGKADAAGEPVVHVSIGRLEVRAAPVAAAPPRRRDGPQPSSLDDYLRQRGGKASP
ncbi:MULTISPECIES: hypothetical protein [Rhodanobacter]|uniref:hypothetical protein n=1 Tax=Rhodanobacter TaxID=75309 RepID=UPI0002610722|nr:MULTISPECIES: hypothetical protein [Rhodanobacter]EIL98212.1 hypothetical protein UUC_17470 [Rhodanobacter denitrificans]KZC21167.1 hypothetical protein RHOFW104R3_21855 [Rhodanobacter denitrificans]UJJ51561.1 hypothetical protein LRK52_02395 [Rhodanobacter denitrificans]UJM90120.1 hypothetical protein LRK24_17065 [Rhodanobacter denitrificans]UJM94306.1 hypothetical protein LRK32_02395 [Rhodanobacter denitrificans]